MRQIDFRSRTLSRENLIAAFSRIWAELGSLGMPCGSGDFLALGTGHLGADLNNAIDRADSAISTLAIILGKTSTGSRAEDFRTGSHDVWRLHAELDRLHARIAGLGQASIPNDMIGKGPLAFHRTGSASYVTTSGAFATAGDGVPRIGVPGPVVRRNLAKSSQDFTDTSAWVRNATYVLIAQGTHQGPDGRMTAHTITLTSGYSMAQDFTVVAGQTYVASWYAQKGTMATPCYSVQNLGDSSMIVADTSYAADINSSSLTRVSKTFTVPAGCTSIRVRPLSGSSSGGTIVMTAVQLDAGALTPYQATKADGSVDLSNPVSGSGIVLEGAGANYILNSGFEVDSNGDGVSDCWFQRIGFPENKASEAWSLVSDPAPYYGTKSQRAQLVRNANAGSCFIELKQEVTVTPGQVWTWGFKWRSIVASTGDFMDCEIQAFNGTTFLNNKVVRTTQGSFQSGWNKTAATHTIPENATKIYCLVRYYIGTPGGTGEIIVDAAQAEPSPFETSYIDNPSTTAPATRQSDQCALSIPGNELAKSHDLTASPWTKTANITRSKVGDLNLITIGGTPTSEYIEQVFAPTTQNVPVPGQARTIAITAKLPASGALNGSVLFRLLDQSGNQITATTINTSDLNTTDLKTFYVTGTAAADDTGLIVRLRGNSGTGGILIGSIRMVPGSFPGVEIRTEDAQIIPSGVVVDPAFSQNGSIEFDCVTIATQGRVVFGTSDNTLQVLHSSSTLNRLVFYRKADPANGIACFGPSTAFDGTKHRIRIEWGNYLLNGVRCMPQRLFFDGTKIAEIDMASLGSTKWCALDRLWISDGSAFATISGPPKLGTPALPAGAIPQT